MTNIYKLNGLTMAEAAKHTCNFLDHSENMETQCLTSIDGVYFIQARTRNGKSKKFLGLDKVISVKLSPIGNEFFSVEIGEGKWVDKGVALAAAWFFCWPLAVTSGVGIYKQKVLPNKILREIGTKFSPECKIN